MKKIVAVLTTMLLAITSFCSVFATENKRFNLIEYLENNEVESRAELSEVLALTSGYPLDSIPVYYLNSLTNYEEVSFEYEIDYENNEVIVDTVYQARVTAYTTSGRVTREVLSINGSLLYTIATSGVFTRNGQTCSATSASGTFQPASSAAWSSTPTITRGSISQTKAYARTSGVARSGVLTRNYNLTLICDISGNLTSTFSE